MRQGASNPYMVPGFKSAAEAEMWTADCAGKSMRQCKRQFDPN
jgi:hypothetical protein